MIDIDAKYFLTVKSILKQIIPKTPVWAFGSRVTGHAKPYSDLDLVIVDKHPIALLLYYQIKDAMEESDLPFRVDILDWHRISPSFKKVIYEKYVIIQ